MNSKGDTLEVFFVMLIGIVFIIAFLPLINDLVGLAITAATAATNLSYMNFFIVLLSLFGILVIVGFLRSWWKTSGVPGG